MKECTVCEVLHEDEELILQPNGAETCHRCTQLSMSEDYAEFEGGEIVIRD